MKRKYTSPIFYNCTDVMKLLSVSNRKAYEVIHMLNEELIQEGYITIAGRVPKKFFNEHFYCNSDDIQNVING